ncbi:MAG: helix-turn-helix domain-containing protein, partial [Candidatus Limnocylindria bacterium]
MTNDDRLFGYRLQLLNLASEIGVRPACRAMGIHHSTYYRWLRLAERHGLEVLRPRERRRPRMPNQIPAMVEERIVAFSLGHAGLGPKRVAAQLRRPQWGGLQVSPNGVWKVLRRHGLSTRKARLALIAGYRAPYEPPREEQPEPHVESSRPGELVGLDCFFVGRLHGTKGAVWQLTACDTYSSYGWAELVVCPEGNPIARQTSALARRVASDLQAAGWRLERVLTDNGNEFRGQTFQRALAKLTVPHTKIRAGRPQTNGHVERLHRTILEDCWRPAFARYLQVRLMGLREELDVFMDEYNNRRDHHGPNTRGRPPADLVYG